MALSRRTGLTLLGALLAGKWAHANVIDGSGLPAQPWFLQSFLYLREDLEAAAAAGKRLAVLVEQKGCPFCRQLHEVNFADPAIVDWIRARFEILQLDLHGAREVTDLDGTVVEERAFARRHWHGDTGRAVSAGFARRGGGAAGAAGGGGADARLPAAA